MDVHTESIDLAVAEEGGEVRHHGQIGGNKEGSIGLKGRAARRRSRQSAAALLRPQRRKQYTKACTSARQLLDDDVAAVFVCGHGRRKPGITEQKSAARIART
jgi:hypothetical protein